LFWKNIAFCASPDRNCSSYLNIIREILKKKRILQQTLVDIGKPYQKRERKASVKRKRCLIED
jgi:hypothetical protein